MKTHDEDMNKDWLGDIRDRMARYETDAPPGLWEEIEKSMDAAESAPVSRPRVIALWARHILDAAAVAVAVVTVVAFMLYQRDSDGFDDDSHHDSMAVLRVDNPCATRNDSSPVQVEHIVSVAEYVAHEASGGNIAVAAVVAGSTSDGLPTRGLSHVMADSVSSDSSRDEHVTEDIPDSDNREKEPVVRRFIDVDTEAFEGKNVEPSSFFSIHSEAEGAFRMSMFTSGGTGARMNSHSAGEMLAVSGVQYAPPAWKDNNSLGLSLLNKGLDTDTEYKHRLPVRAGVTFGWRVSGRWTLETGITYANLASDVREGSHRNYYKGEQRLHYIGIPINAGYRIYTWKRLGVYASAGVLAEKCVSARMMKDFYLNGRDNGREKENLTSRPAQMSVNAGLGVDFNIVGAVSVYAEPGVAYYFDDRSSLETIYKEKPFNFNLDFGLRFTFGH